MQRLHWLSAHDAPDAFPPVAHALAEPSGLLSAGGDLSPGRLLSAYRRGIFPWYAPGQPILWWSPDPRAVLWPRDLHVARRLRRWLRQNPFTYTVDRAFAQVVAACAAPRADADGTWITPEMQRAYLRLHQMGFAHSLEVWRNGALVGGVYGVGLGRVFFAESMFSRTSNASKAALIQLAENIASPDLALIDCQMLSEHLRSLGAVEIRRTEFVGLLHEYCGTTVLPARWQLRPVEE